DCPLNDLQDPRGSHADVVALCDFASCSGSHFNTTVRRLQQRGDAARHCGNVKVRHNESAVLLNKLRCPTSARKADNRFSKRCRLKTHQWIRVLARSEREYIGSSQVLSGSREQSQETNPSRKTAGTNIVIKSRVRCAPNPDEVCTTVLLAHCLCEVHKNIDAL